MSTKAARASTTGKLSDVRMPSRPLPLFRDDVMDLERLAPRHDPLRLRGRPFTSAFVEREPDRLHQPQHLLSRRHVGGTRRGAERIVVEIVERGEPAREEL